MQALKWAWAQEHEGFRAVPTRKYVLIALAEWADKTGRCWPGQKFIASETSLGERTVRRHIVWLEREGFLDRRERRRKSGYRSSDEYTRRLPATVAGRPTGHERQSHRPRATTSPATVSNLTGHGGRANEPEEEPEEEPPAIRGGGDGEFLQDHGSLADTAPRSDAGPGADNGSARNQHVGRRRRRREGFAAVLGAELGLDPKELLWARGATGTWTGAVHYVQLVQQEEVGGREALRGAGRLPATNLAVLAAARGLVGAGV
jgi:hypothetical protein